MFFMLFNGEFVVFYRCTLLLNLLLQDVLRPMQFINLFGVVYLLLVTNELLFLLFSYRSVS